MGFYKSFLNLSHSDIKNHIPLTEHTPDSVVLLEKQLTNRVIRPQILLKDSEDYYISKDTLRKTEYICFKNLLMIDIDTKDSYIFTDNFIKNYFNQFDDYCFLIHKSLNGYHIFVVSRKFDYHTKESAQFMLQNFCDFYYCCFAYIRGYSVRISAKEGEMKPLYKNLGLYGNKSLVNEELLGLTKLVERESMR